MDKVDAYKEFVLFDGKAASLYIDQNDWEGAALALRALQGDIELVSGMKPVLLNDSSLLSDMSVLVGTVGKSAVIDQLISRGKIAVAKIEGKWESYLLATVDEPLPGVSKALVVAGSDKRGTIYGIYKISELIGVSPWVWWADSAPERKSKLSFPADFWLEQGEPAVKYRGFFLNDEAPCLTGWVAATFGKTQNSEASDGYNHEFYQRVFELLLRLKGNYLWPAMWNNSFHTDDPLNSALADTYGIVMGTSHQEHMTCADKEWSWAELGPWNYHTNRENIYNFWKKGVKERAAYEAVLTLGMRGQADTAILGPNATLKDNMELIAQVLRDQREIIKEVYGAAETPPQLLALYKEVEDFYYGDPQDGSLDVPDDVTLLLCDDNFANLRTLPTAEMRQRSGGFGMYYHFDYRGGPISYQWINQTPLTKVWEQMTTAYDAGVDRIWVVNVGDLKPMELPLDYFLNLAYDYEQWSPPNKVAEFTRAFAAREFGAEFATAGAEVLSGYTKLLGARKAEVVMADPPTFSLTAFAEATRILAEFEAIVAKAEAVYAELPLAKKDVFYQLALYPARAALNVYKCNICAAQSAYLAEQGLPAAEEYARLARAAFAADLAETRYYNEELAKGKWNGIMRQNHFNYTSWDGPTTFVSPETMPKTGAIAQVAVENHDYVSLNPERYSSNIASGVYQWVVIDDYGRDGSSVKVLPNGKSFSVDAADAPYLEYSFFVQTAGIYHINTFIAPSGNRIHQSLTPLLEQLRFSTQIDAQLRQTVSGLLSEGYKPGSGEITWTAGVMNNTRLVTTAGGELAVGQHTLRIYAVDPDVVIQKIVIAPPSAVQTEIARSPQTYHFMGSYLGPPFT